MTTNLVTNNYKSHVVTEIILGHGSAKFCTKTNIGQESHKFLIPFHYIFAIKHNNFLHNTKIWCKF